MMHTPYYIIYTDILATPQVMNNTIERLFNWPIYFQNNEPIYFQLLFAKFINYLILNSLKLFILQYQICSTTLFYKMYIFATAAFSSPFFLDILELIYYLATVNASSIINCNLSLFILYLCTFSKVYHLLYWKYD